MTQPTATAGRRQHPSSRNWREWLAWVATTDHCEWANPYVYWVKSPLGVIVLAGICSLLSGLFIAPQGYAIFAAIVAVLLLGLAWPWLAMRGISCRVVFAAYRGRENQPTRAKLVVNNRWPWPVWGLKIANPLAGRHDSETAIGLARINGWSRSTFDCTFLPEGRGQYPKHDVLVGTGFPFGLYHAARPATVPKTLVVWPETFWLPPLAIGVPIRHWSGSLSEVLTGSEGTRHGVRDFRPGDELRDVHWAKSARHDQLIVCEREASTIERLTVVVDVDAARQTSGGRDSTLEWSLRIAASICESVATQQGGVELWLGDERIVSSGKDAVDRLLDAIALFDQDRRAQSGGTLSRGAPSTAASNNPQQKTALRKTVKSSETPPRRQSGAAGRGPANAMVSIGTDASPFCCERSIVLRSAAFDPGGTATRVDPSGWPSGWIEVVSPEDVPAQVLRGWRPGRRGASRAR